MKLRFAHFLAIVGLPAIAQPPETSDTPSPLTGSELAIPEPCRRPAFAGDIPEGATARERDLLEAQARVRSFIDDMDEFIACVNEQLEVRVDDAGTEYRDAMLAIVEAASAEVDEVADAFSDQVAAFRAANGAGLVPRLPETPVPIE